jgi:hypothetical protein
MRVVAAFIRLGEHQIPDVAQALRQVDAQQVVEAEHGTVPQNYAMS